METIGERIRMVRGGESRERFARAMEISAPSLQRYESGTRKPDINFIQKLIYALNLSESWLLTGEGPMYAEPVKSEPAMQPHEVSTRGHDARDDLIAALREQLEMQREHIETLKENAKLAADALQRENEALRGQLEATQRQVTMLEDLLAAERQKEPEAAVDRIQAAG